MNIDKNKLRKLLVGVSLGLILAFIVAMMILVIVALLSLIEINVVLLALIICLSVILISFLVSIAILYCKFSGSPYKSKDHHKKLRYFGMIFGIWTVSFVLKIVLTVIGSNIFFTSFNEETFGESILIMLFCLITEIFPYFCALETKFMTIF